MSHIIVIDSSDEEGENKLKETLPDEQEDGVTKTEIPSAESLFMTFCNHCEELVKDDEKGSEILKFLHNKHELASSDFKLSRPYRKVLQRCISKLKKGSKDVYVHVHNVISVLDKNDPKCYKRLSSDANEVVKKRRITLTATSSEASISNENAAKENQAIEVKTSGDCDPQPVSEAASSSNDLGDRCHKKTKKLELLLKKISNEITRLQSVELSLDDLDEEDTSYIQESKLKRRFMQVYRLLCDLNKSSASTGRVIEKKIRVTGSRFSEINRKVERFINSPKRGFDFPDFSDIFHLVKQANVKSHLSLSHHEIETTSRDVFLEVGEKMKKRRQQDFGFEFGCSLLDEKKDSDPAINDSTLKERLMKNKSEGVKNMESVMDKFSQMQQTINERDPNDPALQEDHEVKESEDYSSDDGMDLMLSDSNTASNVGIGSSNNKSQPYTGIRLCGNHNVEEKHKSESKPGLLQFLKLAPKDKETV